MNKSLYVFLILGWSIIFPSLAFNNFTTDIITNTFEYKDLCISDSRKEIFKSADYDFWLKTIFLSSHE